MAVDWNVSHRIRVAQTGESTLTNKVNYVSQFVRAHCVEKNWQDNRKALPEESVDPYLEDKPRERVSTKKNRWSKII